MGRKLYGQNGPFSAWQQMPGQKKCLRNLPKVLCFVVKTCQNIRKFLGEICRGKFNLLGGFQFPTEGWVWQRGGVQKPLQQLRWWEEAGDAPFPP